MEVYLHKNNKMEEKEMKTRRTKIMCLILSVIMILSTMPMTVFADSGVRKNVTLKKGTIIYTHPYHTNKVKDTFAHGEGEFKNIDIKLTFLYKNVEMKPEDKFIGGEKYTAVLNMLIPSVMASNVKIYIGDKEVNGNQIELLNVEHGKPMPKAIRVRIKDETVCQDKDWDSIKVEVPYPKSGMSGDFANLVTVAPEHADKYKVIKARWKNKDSDTYCSKLEEYDAVYAEITVKGINHYNVTYDPNYDSQVVVNGKYLADNRVKDNGNNTITFCAPDEYVPPAKTIPSVIEIKNIGFIYADTKIKNHAPVCTTEGCHVTSYQWVKIAYDENGDPLVDKYGNEVPGIQLTEEDIFELNEEYYVRVYVAPDPGYKFPSGDFKVKYQPFSVKGNLTAAKDEYYFDPPTVECKDTGITEMQIYMMNPISPENDPKICYPYVQALDEFTIEDYSWKDSNGNEAESFVSGKSYTLEIELTTDETSYYFMDYIQVKIEDLIVPAAEIKITNHRHSITFKRTYLCIDENEVVTDVEVKFFTPFKHGVYPGIGCNANNKTITDGSWSTKDCLVGGKTYTYTFKISPGDGKIFKDTIFTFKDSDGKLLKTYKLNGIYDSEIEIKQDFYCPKHVVENLIIECPEPDVGSNMSEWHFNVYEKDGDINEAGWGHSLEWSPVDSVIMPGKTYKRTITVVPPEGKIFSKELSVKIDDKDIKFSMESECKIKIEQTFKIPEEEKISQISFTELNLPEKGKKAKNISSTDYPKKANNEGSWTDETTKKVVPDGTEFEPGHSYSYTVSINAPEGKKFVDNLAVLINGYDHTMSTEIEFTADKKCVTIKFTDYKCYYDPIKEITITGVEEPADGKAPSVKCNIKNGEFGDIAKESYWYLKGDKTKTPVTKFEAGKTYTLRIYVKPGDFNTFASDCTATINGQKAERGTHFNSGYIFTRDFTCADSGPKKISSDKLIVADGLITGIKAPATVNDILGKINEKADCKILDKDGKELAGDKPVGTGYAIVLYKDGKEVDRVVIVVKGDIDGSGDITSADARMALRTSVNLETLGKAEKTAADVNADNSITADDARKVLRVSVSLDVF